MISNARTAVLTLIVILSLLSSSCSSQDGYATSGLPSASDTYLLLQSVTELFAVDPAHADVKIPISPYTHVIPIPHANNNLQPANSNIQFAYFLNNNILYKLDLRKSSPDALRPIPVSNPIDRNICALLAKPGYDEVIHDDKILLYVELDDSNGTCFSGPYLAFNLNLVSNSIVNYIEYSKLPRNWNIFNASGYGYIDFYQYDIGKETKLTFKIENGNFVVYQDANAVPTVLLNNVTAFNYVDMDRAKNSTDLHIFINIDNSLYTYNVLTGLTDLAIYSTSPFPSLQYLHYSDNRPSQLIYYVDSQIYILEKSSGKYQILLSYPSANIWTRYGYTDSRILFSVGPSSSEFEVYSFSRSTQDDFVLISDFASSSGQNIDWYGNRFVLYRPNGEQFLIDDVGNIIEDLSGKEFGPYNLEQVKKLLLVRTPNTGDTKIFDTRVDKYVADLGILPSVSYPYVDAYPLSKKYIAMYVDMDIYVFNAENKVYTRVLPNYSEWFGIVNQYNWSG